MENKTFSQVLDDILYKLKDKYPRYDLSFVKHKANQTRLMCNGKILYTFNPDFLEKEVAFLKNDENYINFIASVFEEPLSDYHKKESRTVKRGVGSKGISLQRVLEAISHTKSNTAAANFLNVSYNTWKKYASMYTNEEGKTYFEAHYNEKGLGISKGYGVNAGGIRLEDVFAGKHPNYASYKLKRRLVRTGYMKEECSNCGFNERRMIDYKVPLMLDYIDGNPLNKQFENLRLLCYNCYYLLVGDLFWRRKGEFTPAYNTKNKDKKET
jgi:hypothetical protein